MQSLIEIFIRQDIKFKTSSRITDYTNINLMMCTHCTALPTHFNILGENEGRTKSDNALIVRFIGLLDSRQWAPVLLDSFDSL